MAGKGKKRGHSGEHENHERWLLTYADMITLLVAFFIMLYAMSVMNITKFEQLAVSVRSGFGSSMTNGTPTIMDHGGGVNGSPSVVQQGQTKTNDQNDDGKSQSQSELPWKVPSPNLQSGEEEKRFHDLYAELTSYVKSHNMSPKVRIVINERGIVITLLTDKMLFDSGKADLRAEELGLLDEISLVISKEVDNPVEVEGHTDDLPIHTERFPSNWELSATRATTVLRYLGDHGVPWNRLRAAGYADQRPVAPNNTDDGRRRNRRVDIVILRKYGAGADGAIT